MVVTSGAIARGMGVMRLPLRPRAMDELQAASAVGQGKLYQVYDELLRARGLQTAQVLLTFFDMSARTHYLNARQTLRKLLDWRVIPVINENDTTTTDEISFGDNDFLAAQVAILHRAPSGCVLLTDAEGLFTADPRVDPGARLVSEVTTFEELDSLAIGHATSPLGSGGMRSKVVAAEMATAAGIPDRDRQRPRTRARCSRRPMGEPVGTRFAAARRAATRASSCGSSTPSRLAAGSWSTRAPRGRSARAARACCRSGSSTWPASSTRATRSRSRSTASSSARGSATTPAVELRRVRGLKSADVRERLPRATEEAVHRDYFVLA